jgi:hypothetical protein
MYVYVCVDAADLWVDYRWFILCFFERVPVFCIEL